MAVWIRAGVLVLAIVASAAQASAETRAANPAEPAPEAAQPHGVFPSPEELRDLGGRDAPRELRQEAFADVETWTLGGPFPERIGELPVEDPDGLEAILVEAARERAGLVVVSQSMRCVARELGLFFVAKGAFTGRALQRFVLGRCGATGTELGVGYFYDTVPPDASDERVVQAWRSRVAALVGEHLGTGPRAAGIWLGRHEDRAVVLIVTARRRARLDPVSGEGDGAGRLRLRGELMDPAEELFANINRGALGYAACAAAPDVELPRFDLTCPGDPGDPTAWVSVGVRRPGRLLADSLFSVLARPNGSEAATWTRLSYGPASQALGRESFRQEIVERVNALRARSGSPPLVLESQESATAGRLAPFYFGAGLGMLPSAYGDLVALGVMAGWEVSGLIRDAGMNGVLVEASTDVDRWLGEALHSPGMRAVLLDPARTKLAIGPLVSLEEGKQYLAAIVATYELVGKDDDARLRQDLYETLDRAYDARGLSFPRRERGLEVAATREVSRVRLGAVDPEGALNVLMQESSARLGAPVRGWVLEGQGVEHLPLPEDLFGGEPSRIAAAVGHYQPSGAAWARTFALLILTPQTPNQIARR